MASIWRTDFEAFEPTVPRIARTMTMPFATALLSCLVEVHSRYRLKVFKRISTYICQFSIPLADLPISLHIGFLPKNKSLPPLLEMRSRALLLYPIIRPCSCRFWLSKFIASYLFMNLTSTSLEWGHTSECLHSIEEQAYIAILSGRFPCVLHRRCSTCHLERWLFDLFSDFQEKHLSEVVYKISSFSSFYFLCASIQIEICEDC